MSKVAFKTRHNACVVNLILDIVNDNLHFYLDDTLWHFERDKFKNPLHKIQIRSKLEEDFRRKAP